MNLNSKWLVLLLHIQGGPAFSCIHPAVYARITGGYDTVNIDELPNVDKHAGTMDLLEFIDKVYIIITSSIIVPRQYYY